MHNLKEKVWEFSCPEFDFNGFKIANITITDHFLEKHSYLEVMDIYKAILTLPREMPIWKIHEERKIYLWNRAYINNKPHRLIFWFKDQTDNHLWIRNCYRVD